MSSRRRKDFSMDLGSSGLEILLAIFQTPLPTRQQSCGLVGLRHICPHTAAIPLPGPCYSPSSKPLCPPCTETNPQGHQAVLLPPVILRLATKSVLKTSEKSLKGAESLSNYNKSKQKWLVNFRG